MKIIENQMQNIGNVCEIEFEKEYVLQPLSLKNIENVSNLNQKVSKKVDSAVESIKKKYKKLGDTDKFVKTNETRRAILHEADSLHWAELILTVFPYLPAIAESLEKTIDQIAFSAYSRFSSSVRN